MMIRFLFLLSSMILLNGSLFAEKKNLTPKDIMMFKSATQHQISYEGNWVVWVETPDRGDGRLGIKSVLKDTTYYIDRGNSPQISRNSNWIGCLVLPKTVDVENAEKDKPKNSMNLFNTSTGKSEKIENVQKFIFSNDSKWFAYLLNESKSSGGGDSKDSKKRRPSPGSQLFLRHLESSAEVNFQNVTEFLFDSTSNNFTFIVSEPNAKKNSIFNINLTGNLPLPIKVDDGELMHFSSLTWNHTKGLLAYIKGKENKSGEPDSCSLKYWSSTTKSSIQLVSKDEYPEDWYIPFNNKLKWTKDGDRLFFGFKPYSEYVKEDDKFTMADSILYDIDAISKKTELDLWHWNDPRIKTQQRNWWGKNKDKIYSAVYHLNLKRFVQLSDLGLEEVPYVENPDFALGYSQKPYMKEMTHKGFYIDLYSVNLIDGSRKLVVKNIEEHIDLSPLGKFIIYFNNKHWYLYDNNRDTTLNLTARVSSKFWDEEEDTPGDPPPYGLGGWFEEDNAVLIYDRYDIWSFFTAGNYGYLNQTVADGRVNKVQFRISYTEPEKDFIGLKDRFYITGFNELTKAYNIFAGTPLVLGIEELTQDTNKRNRFIGKARNANKILFSRESYDEFPDAWVADSSLKNPFRITNINPQIKDFNWGKTELVKWKNYEGVNLEGFVIKPDNFDPNKKYALLVYYYDRFSSTMNMFYQPRLNHRPCYQWYQNDGYIIFVPDIKYVTGSPGNNAVSCVTSGVRHILKNGYIDSNAIAIQGHSWGGYQTAFMITKTNLFAAACAGAPVGNMTSAYSGIRLESGLARQFQYEMQQSRIGGNLWDSLNSYIANSPVFQAQSIKTPFLIMFGDEDDAVPWHQGVELYLAMRRLNKNCVMLQYRREPHIPRKYQNKMDYAIKMKEFFDTYCLKKNAPEWLLNGIEYKGK